MIPNNEKDNPTQEILKRKDWKAVRDELFVCYTNFSVGVYKTLKRQRMGALSLKQREALGLIIADKSLKKEAKDNIITIFCLIGLYRVLSITIKTLEILIIDLFVNCTKEERPYLAEEEKSFIKKVNKK